MEAREAHPGRGRTGLNFHTVKRYGLVGGMSKKYGDQLTEVTCHPQLNTRQFAELPIAKNVTERNEHQNTANLDTMNYPRAAMR